MGDGPRFDRPPVRATTLTVFVEPIENFDLTMIVALHQRWSEKFPAQAQSYPRRRPDELPEVELMGFPSGWPLPAMEQVDNSLSRKISYQHDQISLQWKFDSEAADTAYPGFVALSRALSQVFDYFIEVVERLGDKPLRVQGCRCVYVNRLDGIEGADWLAGYVSDWQGDKGGGRLGSAEYLGLRVKTITENGELGTRRISMTELDAGSEMDPTRLDIDAVSIPLPDSNLTNMPPAEAASAMLGDAHATLIATFQESANDDMRAKWGFRQ